jgi:LuxR family transcriptional regulator, maltose regulon positive regulatory protein
VVDRQFGDWRRGPLTDASQEIITIALGQWRVAAGGGRVAWVSVDEGDNDPTRFWLYVVAALRTVEPSLGTAALEALRGSSVDLERVVLPSLLGELAAVDLRLVLVLDNYHLVTNATCLDTLGVFLEQLRAGVRLVLSTQVDPPLPLAGMQPGGSWPNSGPPTRSSPMRRRPSY